MDSNTNSAPEIMAREISALNTFWLVQYLNEKHPELDLELLLARIDPSIPGYVENIYSGRPERVTLIHLQNPRYWFSHQFIQALHDLIEQASGDPRLGYKIGRAMYKTKPLVRTSIGLSLLGIHGLASRIASEAAKYNRTKEYLIRKKEKGYVEIRIVHKPGLAISEFTMQWNAGCFASYAKLAGATDISVELQCIERGPARQGEAGRSIWDFYLSYREPRLATRLAKALLRCLPWIRRLTEEAEAIEAEHQDQIFCRDRIIKERTDKLLQIQQRLIEEERQNIENKLRTISRELVATEERERKAIAEDLHDSVTQLLAMSLAKVRTLQDTNSELQELGELRQHLEQSLAELRSLTFQISPPVLYDFGLEAALQWLVEDVNSRYGMRLVYSNLTDSAITPGRAQRAALYRVIRELIVNMIKHANSPDGQILLREEEGCLVVEVEDEGVGFEVDKATMGYGLSTLTDRLLCLHGTLEINSVPGEGTFVRITVPFAQLADSEPYLGVPDATLLETASSELLVN